MAYRLKSVRYQNTPRKILLQNENGPCPLLAAANALLLRGVITLPSACVRNGVASIENVVNMLAERAIKRSTDHAEAAASAGEWKEVQSGKKKSTEKAAPTDESKTVDQYSLALEHVHYHEHHLNDLLSLFPSLQYGMDVNPKFASGPTGVEYTLNLTAFDLLGVELVHGWLLDPQDEETISVIGTKSYNELIEFVVHGSEARLEVDLLAKEIEEKEKLLNQMEDPGLTAPSKERPSEEEGDNENDKREEGDATNRAEGEDTNKNEEGEEPAKRDENGWVNVTADDAGAEPKQEEKELGSPAMAPAPAETDCASASSESCDAKQEPVSPNDAEASPKSADEVEEKLEESDESKAAPKVLSEDEKRELIAELAELRTKHNEKSLIATKGSLVDTFLDSTSHQLTYHGLHELHKHLAEECLCVFFRNNHFATVTKHGGILYLLVTDLGYANVQEVMWEKLDSIDGDTEYVDAFFIKPEPRTDMGPASGPVLSPEQMLAQGGRNEADYQLALQMSKNGGRALNQGELDEQEGKLVAAATEASLKEWNIKNGTVASNIPEQNSPQSQSGEEKTVKNSEPKSDAPPSLGEEGAKEPSLAMHQARLEEDSDRAMALALQAQYEADHESEALARQLQEQENRRAPPSRQSPGGRARTPESSSTGRRAGPAGGGSSCVVS